MHILVTGAAGMLGRKLAARLARGGELGGQEITRMTLADLTPPEPPEHFGGTVTQLVADMARPGTGARLVEDQPDVIFHLAAIVSGEAEADFDKGYAINLDGTRELFDAIRNVENYCPRMVFASSIAVVGAPLPFPIPDEYHATPLTSYGTQKAICELLLADYTRRGIFDGIGLRFPTICIRPGAPNKAASGFFSNILREPLVGQPAILPVPDTIRHWHCSPRSAVGFMIRAATMDLRLLGPRRNLSMPGVSATVADQIEALRRVAGDKAVALIERRPDPLITAICEGWAPGFDARRARDLGFVAEDDFEQIIRAHIEDELEGAK